jgi:hypothetical protein
MSFEMTSTMKRALIVGGLLLVALLGLQYFASQPTQNVTTKRGISASP